MRIATKRVIATAILLAAAVGYQSANACTNLAGYTCFKDNDGNGGAKGSHYGVQYDNRNWNFSSSQKWSNRADWFYNAGRSMNNCLYNSNYSKSNTIPQNADMLLLKRGQYLYTSGPSVPVSQVIVSSYWKNKVSSNIWSNKTTSAGCRWP